MEKLVANMEANTEALQKLLANMEAKASTEDEDLLAFKSASPEIFNNIRSIGRELKQSPGLDLAEARARAMKHDRDWQTSFVGSKQLSRETFGLVSLGNKCWTTLTQTSTLAEVSKTAYRNFLARWLLV